MIRFWENKNKAQNYYKFIVDTTDEIIDEGLGYSARIEVTVNFHKALKNKQDIMDAMNDAYQSAGSVPTEYICDLLANRASGIELAVANLKRKMLGMYSKNSLTACCVLYYISSFLFSRPYDRSWYMPVINYCDHSCFPRCPHASTMFGRNFWVGDA
ncbi:unnamed protein product [Absidia cylindrospora]